MEKRACIQNSQSVTKKLATKFCSLKNSCKFTEVMIEKQIAVVQHYINIRKGKTVNIVIRNARDVFLLQKAYSIAISWFEENNYKIEFI
jgi:hypothetical protein